MNRRSMMLGAGAWADRGLAALAPVFPGGPGN
jgi:hypothetical protein